MKTFVALTAVVCLIPLVLSEDSLSKNVVGVSDFEFDSVIDLTFNVVLFPDIPEFKNVSSGIRGFFKFEDTVYDVLVLQTIYNDTVTLGYTVNKVDGAKIYESPLDLDSDEVDTKDEITIDIYAYKKDSYLQFLVRGIGNAPDTRFSLVPYNITWNDETVKELKANDDKMGFKSPVVVANQS